MRRPRGGGALLIAVKTGSALFLWQIFTHTT